MPKKREEPKDAKASLARDTEEHFPKEQAGEFLCPGCTRRFSIQDRIDAQTAKAHLQNRGHGNYQDLIPVSNRTGTA